MKKTHSLTAAVFFTFLFALPICGHTDSTVYNRVNFDFIAAAERGAPEQAAISHLLSEFSDRNKVAEFVINGGTLLFVYADANPENCGTGGCGFFVWLDKGDGYKDALQLYSHRPIYVASSPEKTALILCTQEGRAEWVLEDTGRFEYTGTKEVIEGAPACTE